MAQADSRPVGEYDVFLSHAGEDAAWCERLAQRLTAAGVRVWFDRWELRAGDHLGARLDDGLEHSRRMVAVWSPHYFRQDKLWTVAESYTRHHGDPLVRDRPLIPVLLADCDVKPMFRSLLYVDFRNPAEFERRFGELLEALGLTQREPGPGLEEPGRRRRGRDVLSPNTWPRPKGADNPGSLLNARYEVVPFHEASRAKELGILEGWCAGEEPTSLRLFYGPGGAGKTRLAIEWVKRVLGRGWQAGFLPEGVPEQDVELVVSGPGPTLVVVDYAEARPELLGVLRRVAARRDRAFGPLRVVLLAREVADWWHSLAKQDAAVADLLGQYEPVRLEPVPLAGPLRQEVFERAWTSLAEIREKTGPLPRPDLADPRFGRMLYLHMAALAAVEGLPLAADTLLEEIVAHEGHFWARPYEDQLDGLLARTEFHAGAARVVAAATLLGGLSSIEAAEALQERVLGPAQKDFCRFLPWLYPGRGKPGAQDYYLSGLEPDLLGETLVAGVLSSRTTRGDFLDRVFESAGPGALRNGFFVLGRISLRRPQEAAGWIAQVLDRDVARRALPAFEAALSLGKETAHAPLGVVLAQSLGREGTADVAAVLEPLLPDLTVSLREVALWATETVLARLPKESPEEDARAKRARLLNNLGVRLSELGRREEALQAAQEAVDIRRTLAAARPDAFLPDLAMSLNNLGAMLSEVGRREEALQAAQEAVEHFRTLAAGRPDAFLPDLAASLNNLGAMLSELGRREEALQAAQEAVEHYRTLAAGRPDAFLPDLAMSLNNLGNRLSELGRREEALQAAQEAVEHYHTLAAGRPDAFLPDLAMSLNNLGNRLSDLGRREEALQAAQEAVDIRRTLAAGRPDAFLPYLATSLNNLGNRLSDLGRREEALQAAREAVQIYAGLVERWPQAFMKNFRISVGNLVERVQESGGAPERDPAVREAREVMVKVGALGPGDDAGDRPEDAAD